MPIHEFQVGNGEGQVPVSKLQRKITMLPRTLRPAAVSDLNYRLKALAPTMQMPKGPMPKGARMPRMPKQQRTGRLRVRTDDRVGGAVVQAALVTVGQAGRDDEKQQQRCAAPPSRSPGGRRRCGSRACRAAACRPSGR